MINNTEKSRFELTENGLNVVADYRHHEDRYVLNHVEADLALRGTGAATRLMSDIVAFARANQVKLVPRCAYAVDWFKQHREDADVIG